MHMCVFGEKRVDLGIQNYYKLLFLEYCLLAIEITYHFNCCSHIATDYNIINDIINNIIIIIIILY